MLDDESDPPELSYHGPVGRVVAEGLRSRKKAHTTPAAVLAHLPLIALGGLALIAFAGARFTVFGLVVTGLIVCVLSTALARADRRMLIAQGFEFDSLPSPYAATVTPWLYLLKRGNALFADDAGSMRLLWRHVGLVGLFLFACLVVTLWGGAFSLVADIRFS